MSNIQKTRVQGSSGEGRETDSIERDRQESETDRSLGQTEIWDRETDTDSNLGQRQIQTG